MYQYICDGVRFAMKTKGMGYIIVEKVCLLVLKLDNVNQNRIKLLKCYCSSNRESARSVGNANPLLIGWLNLLEMPTPF